MSIFDFILVYRNKMCSGASAGSVSVHHVASDCLIVGCLMQQVCLKTRSLRETWAPISTPRHRNTGGVCPKQEGDTSGSYLLTEWGAQLRDVKMSLISCLGWRPQQVCPPAQLIRPPWSLDHNHTDQIQTVDVRYQWKSPVCKRQTDVKPVNDGINWVNGSTHREEKLPPGFVSKKQQFPDIRSLISEQKRRSSREKLQTLCKGVFPHVRTQKPSEYQL